MANRMQKYQKEFQKGTIAWITGRCMLNFCQILTCLFKPSPLSQSNQINDPSRRILS